MERWCLSTQCSFVKLICSEMNSRCPPMLPISARCPHPPPVRPTLTENFHSPLLSWQAATNRGLQVAILNNVASFAGFG